MSIADVTARITEIRADIASTLALRPGAAPITSATGVTGLAGTTSATDFTRALQEATGTTGTDPTGSGSASASEAQQAVVDEAMEYLGLPYVWGGTSKSKGVDCSGLVQSVYASLGHDLPRVSSQQAKVGRAVPHLDQAQPGDILAWDNSSRNVGADHVAIYIGDGKMIEAPRTGLDVRVIDVPKTPDMIRRVLPDASPVSAPGSASNALSSTLPSSLPSSLSAAALISVQASLTGSPSTLGSYLTGSQWAQQFTSQTRSV